MTFVVTIKSTNSPTVGAIQICGADEVEFGVDPEDAVGGEVEGDAVGPEGDLIIKLVDIMSVLFESFSHTYVKSCQNLTSILLNLTNESVPANALVDDDGAVRAVHAGALNPRVLPPVRPEEPPLLGVDGDGARLLQVCGMKNKKASALETNNYKEIDVRFNVNK